MLSELDVINEMLSTLGEAPLNELDEEHPLVPAARRIMRVATYRVLSESWWFNEERATLPHDPDTGEVLTPADTIRADPEDRSWVLVQRGRRLYDPLSGSYNIGKPVKVILIRSIPFADLPPTAQHYVSLLSQVTFNKAYDGDEVKLRTLAADMQQALLVLRAEHARNVDANLLKAPAHQYKMQFIRGFVRRVR